MHMHQGPSRQPRLGLFKLKKTIAFACDHFETYIYGRESVNVETDHQPLEIITKKECTQAPTVNVAPASEVQSGGPLQERKANVPG